MLLHLNSMISVMSPDARITAKTPGLTPSALTSIFFTCHRWVEAKTLTNGTEIAWPAGWTRQEARRWRLEHHLMRRQTWCAQLMENGEVRLAINDPEMAARAVRASRGSVEAFTYWAEGDQQSAVGIVKDEHADGEVIHFTVSPELPRAHTI